MGIFNTVQYYSEIQDDGWSSYAESAANVCRAPGRWLAAEFWGGGKSYVVTRSDKIDNCFNVNEAKLAQSEGWRKVARIVMGLALSIPGEILAIPLMGFAFTSEEIKLKHKVTVTQLTQEESARLASLIDERQKLAKERQGCEPISCCLLFSICYLLCCICLSHK